MSASAPLIRLNDGRTIPQVGLGTWRVEDKACEALVPAAIQAGYRLIDTAAIYGNERGVGEGVRSSGVPREELFITTKLWNDDHGWDSAVRAAEESLRRLRMDYVDLYLIHWPVPARNRYVESWRALIGMRERGLARSIGVSNFHENHLDAIIAATGVTPAVNQIELHPRLSQSALRACHARRGIVTESWSPLAQGGLVGEPAIAEIGRRLRRTPAQVILRWHIEHGLVAIPKSSSPERVRENLALFDFSLAPEDRRAIDALDRAARVGPDPDHFG